MANKYTIYSVHNMFFKMRKRHNFGLINKYLRYILKYEIIYLKNNCFIYYHEVINQEYVCCQSLMATSRSISLLHHTVTCVVTYLTLVMVSAVVQMPQTHILQMSAKFEKDVFLVPTLSTWGGFMMNFLFSPATISGLRSRMMSNTRLRSYGHRGHGVSDLQVGTETGSRLRMQQFSPTNIPSAFYKN